MDGTDVSRNAAAPAYPALASAAFRAERDGNNSCVRAVPLH